MSESGGGKTIGRNTDGVMDINVAFTRDSGIRWEAESERVRAPYAKSCVSLDVSGVVRDTRNPV